MRSPTIQDFSLPQPGTPEAIELGCTCRFIDHDAKLEEVGPAGMVTNSRVYSAARGARLSWPPATPVGHICQRLVVGTVRQPF